jgi:hypothetical protein
MNKSKAMYSGRDGSWSGRSVDSAKGLNKIMSATVGTSQKVRSGEKSQKTYKQPEMRPGGKQVHIDYRNNGMTHHSYTIKSGKK